MLDLEIPAIELPRTGRMTVRTPQIPDMRRWFFDNLGWGIDMGADPEGFGGVTLPRTRLDQVVDLLLIRWVSVELFRQYVPQARCTHRCRFATKLLCTCPCSGEQHGSQAAEQPLSMEDFELIGTGADDWSMTVIGRCEKNAAGCR